MRGWISWIVYVVIALAAYPFLRTGGFADQWLGPYGFWIVPLLRRHTTRDTRATETAMDETPRSISACGPCLDAPCA